MSFEIDGLRLLRLLQLASPALPVGAYTYSQGLEWAVESGTLRNEGDVARWIGDVLSLGIGRFEAPLLAGLMAAFDAADSHDIARLNADFLASRESAELRAETVQMGYSLRRLIADLREPELASLHAQLDALPELAFPTAWAGLAAAWHIGHEAALCAYLWSWAENQTMAALKSVPLGQAAGQRLLSALGQSIPAIAATAMALPEASWCNLTPAFAIASARHETQYSRLFRS